MSKVFIFGFDGVICNSIEECLIISYNAFINNDQFLLSNSINQKNDFIKYRYLVGPAKYFYSLWHLILDKNSNNNLKDRYKQFKPDEFNLNEFENRFYKLRSDMIENNLKYWKSLNPFFKKVFRFHKRFFFFEKSFTFLKKY